MVHLRGTKNWPDLTTAWIYKGHENWPQLFHLCAHFSPCSSHSTITLLASVQRFRIVFSFKTTADREVMKRELVINDVAIANQLECSRNWKTKQQQQERSRHCIFWSQIAEQGGQTHCRSKEDHRDHPVQSRLPSVISHGMAVDQVPFLRTKNNISQFNICKSF